MLTRGQAARLAQTSKTTLTRARPAATQREDAGYQIDPAELARVYELATATPVTVPATDDEAHHARPRDTLDLRPAAAALTGGEAALAFLWVLATAAWLWIASKVMGWSPEAKYDREKAYLDRQVQRARRLNEKDLAFRDNANRRRGGAVLLTVLVGGLALIHGLPWWETAIAVAATLVGLHKVGGVAVQGWNWELRHALPSRGSARRSRRLATPGRDRSAPAH